MNKTFFSGFLILISCFIASPLSYAEESQYNGELTFMYNHDKETCGNGKIDQNTIEKFTIKNLPKFKDFPAEKPSAKTLDYVQLKALSDKGASLNLHSKEKSRANFNGHYLVVFGQANNAQVALIQ